jgi:translation initiation factor RLI1
MYVNNFSNGNTYIFNEHDEIIKESIQDKDKFIVFSGEPHAQGFCAPGEMRIVLAYTFI